MKNNIPKPPKFKELTKADKELYAKKDRNWKLSVGPMERRISQYISQS